MNGKRLNSPNDVAVHPDGGIWFTDPGYGIRGNYEGFKGEQETKEAVYRVDGKTGQMDKVTDEVNEPNGLCFSPDYKKLYIADTGTGRDIRRVRRRRPDAANLQTRFIRSTRELNARRSPTASAATWTATSGPARGRACR